MLTVQDIQAKQFHVRFRGFDPGEVDEFLEQVAAALQAANYENSRLKEQAAAAERKVTTYKQQEKSSLSAILSAQKIADEMKQKADNEARELLAKTRQEAQELTSKARQEAQELTAKARQEARELEESAGREVARLERELDRLRAMKDQAREEVRQLLEGYLAQIRQDDGAPAGAGTTMAGAGAAVSGVASAFIRPVEPAEASEEAEEAEEAPPAATAADESDDLYQSIELSDDLLTLAEEKDESAPAPAAQPAEPAAEVEDLTIPDLDGDMIFTLEDPLDQEESEEDKTDNLMSVESVDLLLPEQEGKEGEEERLVIDDEELQLLDQDDLLGAEPDLNISLDDDEEPSKA